MNVSQNDDELSLRELERRDGIYSFIYHELEPNNLQADLEENHNKRKQNVNEFEENLKLNEDLFKRHKTPGNSLAIVTPSPLLCSATRHSTGPSLSKHDLDKNFLFQNSKTTFDRSWQTHLNWQFQTTSNYPSIQQFCSLRTFNVRRAKTPFSHIQVPLVRNRRHKLKETKEYANFMQHITKVADLRELFPLDPDVHAPFPKGNVKATAIQTKEMITKEAQFLK